MKKVLLPLFLVMFALGCTLMFAAADFSGTWIFNKSKSDPMRGRGGEQMDVQITLTIEQTAGELMVTRLQGERSTETKYALDGSETKSSSRRGEVASKCRWDGDTLVIESKSSFTTPDGATREMNSSEAYSLSADGKELILTTTRQGRQGEQTTKQVYNKK